MAFMHYLIFFISMSSPQLPISCVMIRVGCIGAYTHPPKITLILLPDQVKCALNETQERITFGHRYRLTTSELSLRKGPSTAQYYAKESFTLCVHVCVFLRGRYSLKCPKNLLINHRDTEIFSLSHTHTLSLSLLWEIRSRSSELERALSSY